MKIFAPFCLLLLLLVACTDAPVKSTETLAPLSSENLQDTTVTFALQQLLAQIQATGNTTARYNAKSQQIIMGDTIIGLNIKVEFDGQRQGKQVFAASFETTLKTITPVDFTIGAIGMGASVKEAYRHSTAEWMNTFGNALADLLAHKDPITVKGFEVYAGEMGLRGNLQPNTWLTGNDAMVERIVSRVKPLITTNKHDIVAVDIKLLLDKNGASDGECRIDNLVSFELLKKLKQLDWPSTKEKVIFSQYYLIVKNADE